MVSFSGSKVKLRFSARHLKSLKCNQTRGAGVTAGGVFQGKEGCIMRLHRNTKLVFAFGNMTVAINYLQAFPFEKVD